MSDDLYEMSDEDLEDAFRAASEETGDYEGQEPDTNDTDDTSDTEDKSDIGKTPDVGEDPEEGDDEQEGDEDGGAEKSTVADPEAPRNFSFKAVGKEYTITEDEMRSQFPKVFAQAMDYTRKMQAIAPWRRSIDALEQAKLSHEDVNLMVDVLKGDKGAIAEVLKRTGVDTLDLDPDEDVYTPREYGRDSIALDIQDVVESISSEPEYQTTHRILTKGWDNESWQEFAKDPNKIAQLHQDVKSGIYGVLQGEADKLKVYDGAKRRDLDYYMEAARTYYQGQVNKISHTRSQESKEREEQLKTRSKIAEVTENSNRREADKQAAGKRRAAAPTGRATPKSKGIVDYMDISEEDFEDWYKRLEAQM